MGVLTDFTDNPLPHENAKLYGVIWVIQQVKAHIIKPLYRVWFQLKTFALSKRLHLCDVYKWMQQKCLKGDLKRGCQPHIQLGLSSIHPDAHATILGWKQRASQAEESCFVWFCNCKKTGCVWVTVSQDRYLTGTCDCSVDGSADEAINSDGSDSIM